MQMPPLNELYIVTHNRNYGIDIDFIDAQFELEKYNVLVENKFKDIRVVVLMSSTQSFQHDIKVISRIKEINPDIISIFFGSHPTFMPNYCLQHRGIDYIVLREPEESIRVLLNAIERNQPVNEIEGIGYRAEDGKIVINPHRKFIDMDDLPIPDRSLLSRNIDYFNPVVKKMPYTTMQTSRGCPGRCIFCTAPGFYGRKIRNRSPENVLEELSVIKSLGYREVFFRDETFTAYKKRNVEICEGMLRKSLNLSWIANSRVDMIDNETMRLMKKAGCHMLKFGIETGSNAILKNYKKDTTCEQAEVVFRAAKEIGIKTHAHIIFGGPGETQSTIAQTIDFVKKLNPTTASFGIVTPYPGTELFEMVEKKHPEIKDGSDSNMENLHVTGFYSEAICGMEGQKLSKSVIDAYRKFYWSPSYLFKRLSSIRSKDELFSLIVAGSNILNFSITGEK